MNRTPSVCKDGRQLSQGITDALEELQRKGGKEDRIRVEREGGERKNREREEKRRGSREKDGGGGRGMKGRKGKRHRVRKKRRKEREKGREKEKEKRGQRGKRYRRGKREDKRYVEGTSMGTGDGGVEAKRPVFTSGHLLTTSWGKTLQFCVAWTRMPSNLIKILNKPSFSSALLPSLTSSRHLSYCSL